MRITAEQFGTISKKVFLGAVLLSVTQGFSQHRRFAPELNARLAEMENSRQLRGEHNDNQMIEVIVQFRPGTVLSRHVSRMLGLGARHKTSLDLINSGVFRIPARLFPVLANDPDVLYISPDRKMQHTSDDYALDAIGANYTLSLGYYGNGIGIAVIDSGIKTNHPDLLNPSTGASRVVYSQSFVSGLDASDQYGHGTHVAGLLAGNGQSSGGWMRGVAPKANLINLRVLDANGVGTDSQVIAAIQRAIQLKNTYNIRVINLSVGRKVSESYTLDPVCQAVEQAWKAGIVVVVAAGNYGRDNSMNTNGYATITSPGNDPYVITVGALNTHATDSTADDTTASYSSKGPSLGDHVIKPDIMAPGNGVVSLLASGSTLDTNNPGDRISPSAYGSHASTASYMRLSGTSMATPLVSGAVAAMLQRTPALAPDQVKIILMQTAYKNYAAYNSAYSTSTGSYYSLQNDLFQVGTGYLNVWGAVNSNDSPTGNAISPVATRDSSNTVRLSANASSAWATSIIWGSAYVWGSSVINANSIVWGNSAVWGDTQQEGNSIVWGTSIVWGNSLPMSESSDSDQN